ncbi:hypothetical protein P3T23_005459 [Paraburkholderia sp. GAS448]
MLMRIRGAPVLDAATPTGIRRCAVFSRQTELCITVRPVFLARAEGQPAPALFAMSRATICELGYVESPLDSLLADTLIWMRQEGLIGR